MPLPNLAAIIFFAQVITAERSRIDYGALELHDDFDFDASAGRGQGPKKKENCPQWLPLKEVLLKLGIQEPDPHMGGSISWKGCKVIRIILGHQSNANGTLDDRIGKLISLKKLDLQKTNVAGDLSDLQSLTKLEHLILSSTNVAGEISGLQNLTKLRYLDLSSTKVAGDLSGLQSLTKLRYLDLTSTNVAGDLSGLQSLIELGSLYLRSTTVAGDFAGLQNITKLDILDLSSTNVAGDLSGLQSIPQLFHLDLTSTNVAGDLSSLHSLTKLECLELRKTNVAGDLSGLQTLTQLQELNLDSTKVAGDFAGLQSLSKLERLYLSSTKVAGELSGLSSLTKLEHLDLSNTKVRGDLAGLQNLSKLRYLYLSSTNVAGDLSGLQNLTKLRHLYLTSTNVAGDLAGLQNLTRLFDLDLTSTNVAGDLSGLQRLTMLECLHLGSTNSGGDLSTLLHWKDIESINLEHTHVVGRISSSWRGQAIKLRTMKLSNSQVEFLPTPEERFRLRSYFTADFSKSKVHSILPQLNLLELSSCPLKGEVSELLLPLGGCSVLAGIKAANCSLTGAMPSLTIQNAHVNFVIRLSWASPLSQSLEVLDLSSNSLSRIEAVSDNLQVLILAGNPVLTFAGGVLRKALATGKFIDLQNVTLANRTEAQDLLKDGSLALTDQKTSVSMEGGHACYSITSTSLTITPSKFLPEELCSCFPGFEGKGAHCTKCPRNTYSPDNGSICMQCPPGTTAGEGEMTCQCRSGGIFEPHQSPWCKCPPGEASNGTSNGLDAETEVCLPCHHSHVVCSERGMLLTSAPPQMGFARLGPNATMAMPCHAPKNTRCNNSGNGSTLGCALGYQGILCSDCAAKHYLRNNQCTPCPTEDFSRQSLHILAAAGGVVVFGVGIGGYMWLRRSPVSPSETVAFSAFGALKEQLQQQASILLQMCQLWTVLAVLMDAEIETEPRGAPAWEIPYIEASQLSLASFKGAFNLQCRFDGAMVRLASALIASVAPVVIVICCLALEMVDHGFGVAAALKALTLFYVGGASAASKLLSCQKLDGEGVHLPPQFAYRKWLPHLPCDGPSLGYLDATGYASSLIYGIVVPCGLAYLYARQQQALLPGKRMVALAAEDQAKWKIHLTQVSSSESAVPMGDVSPTKCLLAASSAHIAVQMKGPVTVALKDGLVVATPITGLDATEAPHLSATALSTEAILSILDDEKSTVRRRELAEAMVERCLFEEAESSERALAGSKKVLLKYSRGRFLFMEIIQKLVAMALVSVVQSADGLQLSLAITLLMAAASGMVQPFLQPQVNMLQCCCFLCLALAAVSFSNGITWLSRVALLLPFLLSGSLALRPDSTESLAVRIWEQLKKEMPKLEDGKSVEILVETVAFI